MLVTVGLAQNLVVVCYFADIGHSEYPPTPFKTAGRRIYIFKTPTRCSHRSNSPTSFATTSQHSLARSLNPLMQHPSGDCSDQHCSLFYAPQRSLNMRFLKTETTSLALQQHRTPLHKLRSFCLEHNYADNRRDVTALARWPPC